MKDWDALYEECIHCQKCGLAETRTNVVFGEGARDAEVMFIGEGPGEAGGPHRPALCGPGGPAAGRYAGHDRPEAGEGVHRQHGQVPPAPEPGIPCTFEQEAWYRRSAQPGGSAQAEHHRLPGRIAAMKLIKEDFKITREHGQWLEKAGVWMMANDHLRPAAGPPQAAGEASRIPKSLQAKSEGRVCAHTEESERNSASLLFCGHPLDDLQTGNSPASSSRASVMKRMVPSRPGMTMFCKALARFWVFLMASARR